jgi:hypothetical protein
VGAQGLGPVVCRLSSFPTLGSDLLPTCCQPSCRLFTDGSCASSPPCPSSLLWCTFSNFCPLCCVLVFSSVVYSVFGFFVRGISLSRGVVLVYPRGGWGMLHNAWLSPVWCAEGLPNMFGAGGWWQQQCWQCWQCWRCGGGGLPALSVYCGMRKPSMS